MVRRVTISQYNSMVRQANQKRAQVVRKYNQAVSTHNQKVKRAHDDQNRQIRKHNQDVRAYNSKVRANRQRIKTELSRLQSKLNSPSFSSFRVSVNSVNDAYFRLERGVTEDQISQSEFLVSEFPAQENANNFAVMNALLGDELDQDLSEEELSSNKIINELSSISPDLDNRWHGALFSLKPQNPDAGRHFCTSAREIFVEIFRIKAPDEEVLIKFPNCGVNHEKKPTKRSKIHFLLSKKGLFNENLEEFIEKDIENILELFSVFNEGTHGSAGKFELHKLITIKKRVEDGIIFLSNLVH